MKEFLNASFGARASAFVKGVRVRTTHLDRKKTVKGTHHQNSRSFKFYVEDKKQDMTVEQYFKWSKFISTLMMRA